MPNFNTHWLVAINIIDHAPDVLLEDIKKGYEYYRKHTRRFGEKINYLSKVHTLDGFATFKKEKYPRAIQSYHESLKSNAYNRYDNVTCFSAYMLGACGPDFWTLPTASAGLPQCASLHFDLGHYNRTQQQFECALWRWKEPYKGSSLQKKVEQAYFLGMATHFSTDLIMHQLVNTYAGAYNFLEHIYENEHGYFIRNNWNTHNKVEHYWDSYIRFRYLGNYGPVFFDKAGKAIDRFDKKNINKDRSLMSDPCDFLVVDILIQKLNKRIKKIEMKKKSGRIVYSGDKDAIKTYKTIVEWLSKTETRCTLEQGLNFPRIVCDRLISKSKDKKLKYFIYDVVVDKIHGVTAAYPDDIIFEDAKKEAKSGQMEKGGNIKSEHGKLTFFSTALNTSTDNYFFHSPRVV